MALWLPCRLLPWPHDQKSVAVAILLAALAERVGSIDMPALRADQRGADLSPEEMDEAGAALSWYEVYAL